MKKRAGGIIFLVAGLALAFWLWKVEQHEQHLRFVLGSTAPKVTRFAVDYGGTAGTELAYPLGSAPRIIAHDPRLSDGTYHLRIDVDLPGGRKTIERDVSLSGGTTSVDLWDALQ